MSHVLIVEDDGIVAADLESMLRSAGHTIAGVARTGREAVELAKANMPDLVLLDVMLADHISGMEVKLIIERELKRSICVIFLSAVRLKDYPELQSKITDGTFLPKPYTIEALLNCIETVMKSR